MRSTTHNLESIVTVQPAERVSLRVENGIEIFEHETVKVCRIPLPTGSRFGDENEPKLVVDESVRAEGMIFTKRRSEIAGLSAVLNSIMGLR